jgi:TPR repeat protein
MKKIDKKKSDKIDLTKLYLKGISYFYGIDTSINYKKAYENFHQLMQESKSYLKEAYLFLGQMYYKGLYAHQSYKKAIEYFKLAAKNGSSKAYYYLGEIAEIEILDEEDKDKSYDDMAFNYYKKSADLGLSEAYAKIGVILEQGLLHTKQNLQEAAKIFKKSVDIDENPIGLNGLGNAYYEGKVCERNYAQAFDLYDRAINLGNIDALNNAGICYEYGFGTDKNKTKALELYKKAMDKYHGEGMANYAILKIKNAINSGNYECFGECLKILFYASLLREKNSDIYYYIGIIYELGIDLFNDNNIIKNSYLAFVHYKKAAKLGNAKAYTKMGICLFNGIEGVIPKNRKSSEKLLEKAIELGDKEAEKYLKFIQSQE